jgi:raffinose/stachyose/melibiose transport system permease protein
MRQTPRETLLTYLLLGAGSILALYPFVSIALLALNAPGAPVSGFSIPSSVHLGNFAEAWRRGLFGQALTSSLVVTLAVVAATAVLSLLGGYALGVLRLPGAHAVQAILLVGLVVPTESLVIPLYHEFRALGLINTYQALILPQVALALPFGLLWMRAAFVGTPASLREAAALDGAGRWKTLWWVLVPLVSPALGALASLVFLYSWNEFLLALVLVPNNPRVQTAPLVLSFFSGARLNDDPGVIAAAAVIVALPVLVAYFLFQRRFMSGLLAGSVKE